jgi:hypothetical protein
MLAGLQPCTPRWVGNSNDVGAMRVSVGGTGTAANNYYVISVRINSVLVHSIWKHLLKHKLYVITLSMHNM